MLILIVVTWACVPLFWGSLVSCLMFVRRGPGSVSLTDLPLAQSSSGKPHHTPTDSKFLSSTTIHLPLP
jgi:hypothetical protein